MDLRSFDAWLELYFVAWASNDAHEVASLFSEDAEYSWGPFRESARGRDDIVRAWVDGGAPSELRYRYKPIAFEGDCCVAHWSVAFRDNDGVTELDGILVCTFDADGRCTHHREWYDRRDTTGGPITVGLEAPSNGSSDAPQIGKPPSTGST